MVELPCTVPWAYVWGCILFIFYEIQPVFTTHLSMRYFAIVEIVCTNISWNSLFKRMQMFKTLRPRENGRHFADDMFKCIFLNENVWIPIKISLKFVPKGPINNIPALVQIMAWRRPGEKPLSEPMIVSVPTHICAARPQWVKVSSYYCSFINPRYIQLIGYIPKYVIVLFLLIQMYFFHLFNGIVKSTLD